MNKEGKEYKRQRRKEIQRLGPGEREKAQQVRVCTDLPEDLSSLPSIHARQHTLPVTPVPGI